MNPKVKTLLRGAAEAFGLGVLAAIPWTSPSEISLTGPALAGIALIALKSGIFYFLGFVRLNAALRAPESDTIPPASLQGR